MNTLSFGGCANHNLTHNITLNIVNIGECEMNAVTGAMRSGWQNEWRYVADEDEAKSDRRVCARQDSSEGSNERAADRTNKAVNCRVQRFTDAALDDDHGR